MYTARIYIIFDMEAEKGNKMKNKMSIKFNEEHCSRWGGIPIDQDKLNDATRLHIEMVCRAFRCGVYDLGSIWRHMEISSETQTIFYITNGLRISTFDSDTLTRLVIAAHENRVRFGIDLGCGESGIATMVDTGTGDCNVLMKVGDTVFASTDGYDKDDPDYYEYESPCVSLVFSSRETSGDMIARHPTIEQAIENYRTHGTQQECGNKELLK